MPSRDWRLRIQDILQEIVWIAIQNNLPLLVSPLREILDREESGE